MPRAGEPSDAAAHAASRSAAAQRRGTRHRRYRRRRAAAATGSGAEPRTADGIREVRRLFQSAQNPPRWPMYIRQVKQFLRNVDATFDERKFGFASLVDLLRACQREGLFRIERDRQGVMRFFPGNVMQGTEPVTIEPETEDDGEFRVMGASGRSGTTTRSRRRPRRRGGPSRATSPSRRSSRRRAAGVDAPSQWWTARPSRSNRPRRGAASHGQAVRPAPARPKAHRRPRPQGGRPARGRRSRVRARTRRPSSDTPDA